MPEAIMTSALLVTYQCTMNMSISTTHLSLTVKKVNSRSSHTVGKGKEIRMDLLNPNKISTRFRK